jgi:hypothetical protein
MMECSAMGVKTVLACALAVLAFQITTGAQAAPLAKANMKTICIGRHQIDVPRDFEPSPIVTGIFTRNLPIDGSARIEVQVHSERLAPEAFRQLVTAREAALREAGGSSNKLTKVIALPGLGAIFRINVIEDAYENEIHLLKNGVHVVATTESFDNKFEAAEARLTAFGADLAPLADAGQAPGFCLGGVVLTKPYAGEDGGWRFVSKTYPDLAISIDLASAGSNAEETLLEQNAERARLMQGMVRMKQMRARELKVAGMRAQEWLGWAMLGRDGDVRMYDLEMATVFHVRSPTQPSIQVRLGTGQGGSRADAPGGELSEQAVLALWDSVIATIRLRAD